MKTKQTKQTKAQRIAVLERKLKEAEAAQVYGYYLASTAIDGASTDHLASGVILSLTALGGREIFSPVLIHNGLSKETIEALKADFMRSYESAVEFKPKGVK